MHVQRNQARKSTSSHRNIQSIDWVVDDNLVTKIEFDGCEDIVIKRKNGEITVCSENTMEEIINELVAN